MGKTTVDRNDNVRMYKGSSKYSKYSEYFFEKMIRLRYTIILEDS